MIERIDLRKVRADQAVTSILHYILDRYVPSACREDAHRDLYQKFMEAGAEILTDAHRQEAGLPPRGPDGWTLEEIIALEKHRLEMLTKPLAF